ncbi:MAG: GAF domain-containing protein [Planctomycetota bacterium]
MAKTAIRHAPKDSKKTESQRLDAVSSPHHVDMMSLTPISEALGADKSPTEVLKLILNAAFSVTRATSASLMLLDDEDNLSVEVAEGFKGKRIFNTRLKVGQGVTGWVAETGVALRLGNVAKDPRYVSVQQDLKSELAVPMKIGGRVIGVISCDSSKVNHFTEEDEALLTSLAAQSARVIQSTQLYEEARRRADELQLLGDVTRALNSSLDLREVLAKAVELTAKVCNARIVSVFLLNDAETDFDMAACHGGSDAYRQQPPVPAAGSLLGRVIESTTAMVIEDAHTANEGSLLSLDAGVRSLLAVPLISKERPVGVLCVFGAEGKRFDNHDRSLLESLALSSALAIENARVHRHMLQAEETLRRSEKHSMLGELAAGLAHEIRNPLTSIKMLFGSIHKTEKFSLNASQDADMIVKQIARLESIVEGFLNTARAQVAPTEMKVVDFNATVDESMLLLASSASEGTRMIIDLCDGELSVKGDGTQLSQVVYNLVLNAIQAVDKRGRVCVRTKILSNAPDGRNAILEIADDGPGLAEKVHQKLFQPFVTTKKSGVGLGLSIVKRIVESHCGRLDVESPRKDIGRGALFRVSLPSC